MLPFATAHVSKLVDDKCYSYLHTLLVAFPLSNAFAFCTTIANINDVYFSATPLESASFLQNVSSETQNTASDTANGELVGGTSEVCGGWLDGRTSSRSSARWWSWGCKGGCNLAWCAGCESCGCWHGCACGEWAVGDGDSLLGSSSVGRSFLWSWYHKCSAGWADSSVALNGSGAVDDTGGCDGDAGSESCGLGECAWAL